MVWLLRQGDACTVLRTLPAQSIHCCVTSPPYWGQRVYGAGEQELGQEATPQAYVAHLVAVFAEVWRVLRDDGTLWLNLGDKITGKQLLGMPWRVAFALQEAGWILRQDIVWNKPNTMPESVKDRPTTAHEYVFLFSKRPRYFYDVQAIAEPCELGQCGGVSSKLAHAQGGNGKSSSFAQSHERYTTRNARSVWSLNTSGYAGQHCAVFPPALADRCIRAGTSEAGCCRQCGAPWRRIVSKKLMSRTNGWNWKHAQSQKTTLGLHTDYGPQSLGFAPACSCPAFHPFPIPCTVLDPFAGAGTTLLQAERLGRDSVGIELHPATCLEAQERLQADQPLFIVPTRATLEQIELTL